MKRIKSFELGSHRIKVKYQKSVKDPETGEEILGLCNPLTNTILVATEFKKEKLSEDAIVHNFYHEVSHYIMALMSLWELNNNEVFIDGMGMHLAQLYRTQR